MITYTLNDSGTFAQRCVDGVPTGEWANINTNEAYLRWLEEGNTPLPADEVTE